MSAPIASKETITPMTPTEGLGAAVKSGGATWIAAPFILALVFVGSLAYALFGGDRDLGSVLHRFGGAEGESPVFENPVV